MAFALEALLAVAVIGWVSRYISRQLSYRETCRLRLRAASYNGVA